MFSRRCPICGKSGGGKIDSLTHQIVSVNRIRFLTLRMYHLFSSVPQHGRKFTVSQQCGLNMQKNDLATQTHPDYLHTIRENLLQVDHFYIGRFIKRRSLVMQVNLTNRRWAVARVQWLWEETYVPKVVGSNPSTVYWVDIFTHLFVVKIVMLTRKRRKISEKETWDGPCKKKPNRGLLTNNFGNFVLKLTE